MESYGAKQVTNKSCIMGIDLENSADNIQVRGMPED